MVGDDGQDLLGGLGQAARLGSLLDHQVVEVRRGLEPPAPADLGQLHPPPRIDGLQRRLSKAALETLAIVAYHQPVTRADIEAIRGVQASKGTLDALLELGLVRMRGRRRSPGRPITYGTTDRFLEHYGLPSLGDLPGAAEMKAAGLLSLELPPDFAPPDPTRSTEEEDPLEPGDEPEFHQDFLGEEQG